MNAVTLTPYEITFKKHATARKCQTWTRYGESVEAARESVLKVLAYEFSGEAVLVSVVESTDARYPR